MTSAPFAGEKRDSALAPAAAAALHLLAVMLAWAGVLLCVILLSHHRGVLEALCGTDARCDEVLASRFGVVRGVPISWAGLAFYSLTLAALLAAIWTRDAVAKRVLTALEALVLVAVLVSAGLMYVQVGILHAFCPLCTVSAVLSAALSVVLHPLRRRGAWSGGPIPALALGLAFLSSTVVVAWVLYLPGRDPVVASVDEWFLRESELGKGIQLTTDELEGAEYQAKMEWLEEKIDGHLLEQEAARRGMSLPELLRREVEFPADLVKAGGDEQSGKGGAREDPAMTEQKALRKEEFIQRLKAGRKIRIFLHKPLPTVVHPDLRLAKILGPKDAPVKLVVFSDFECPLCARMAKILNRVHENFPERVTIAYRYYPLPSHPHAFRAAEAAECAAEQGKFWQFHDELFRRQPPNEKALFDAAAAAGVDLPDFEACLRSGRGRKLVEASYKDGTDIGIYGTPLLFLNGRKIGGVVEYADLVEMIEGEMDGSTQPESNP